MESLSKNKIKWVKSLRLKKNRDAENLFVVEGPKTVEEFENNWPDSIVLRCSTDENKSNYFHVSEREMKEMSSLKTASSTLIVAQKIKVEAQSDLTLVLDGIQDPGNMGTIIRAADWFGITEIICSKETVDVYNPKVVQSTMGSINRVNVTYTDLVSYLKSSDKPTYGSLLNGENIYATKLAPKANLIIGNEGQGITPEVQELIQYSILIPGKGKAESLNAAIATGILLAEFTRPV